MASEQPMVVEKAIQPTPKVGITLVVGDWFVDEHWICGIHRSRTSSRTGTAHLRALHPIHGIVQSFCGAGRTASFLHAIRGVKGSKPTTLLGLGFWHHRDTEALSALFVPENPAQNPYRLTVPDRKAPDGIHMLNLHDALHKDVPPGTRDTTEYTTRIIRTYRKVGHDERTYERLDWEPEPSPANWSKEQLDHLLDKIRRIEDTEGPIRNVVVKDLLKGAITDAIIEALAKGPGRRADWYVSSKKWRPSWFRALSGLKVKLLLIPQVAANEAISEKELTCWITRSGRVSQEAFRLIDDITKQTASQWTVILPEGFSAVAHASDADEDEDLIVQPKTDPERLPLHLGGASIVFPALIAYLQHNDQPTIQTGLPLALKATLDWVKREGEQILKPESWIPDAPPELPESVKALWAPPQTTADFAACTPYGRRAEEEAWAAALTNSGIIPRGTKKQLQLWRSMVEVDGYVCCEKRKRRQLRDLVEGIAEFAKSPTNHVACMLVATPGSGKTFLVERLAKAADLKAPLLFNITQMRSRFDIIRCFDTIRAAQEEDRGRPLLVFVDEVNAKLGGTRAYSAFLAPLEDGAYVNTGGQPFHLDPCAWIFAGTEDPEKADVEKGSDFASRLGLGILALSEHGEEKVSFRDRQTGDTMQAVEAVYLGATLLRAAFPEVRFISEYALQAFSSLSSSITVRDMKHFVRRFQYINYGRVTSANVPAGSWPRDTDGSLYQAWRSRKPTPEEADVEITLY